jgi:hypothetical protein
MAELQKIDSQYGDTSDESLLLYSQTIEPIENEITHLQQRKLINRARYYGIDMPNELWESREHRLYPVLTHQGEARLRREVSKYRREVARDWVAIMSPVASAIIAILGLLVALKKH